MLTDTDRNLIQAALEDDQAPASPGLLHQIAQAHKDVRNHTHTREDWYCTNLVAFIGEHSGPILKLLLDLDTDNRQLRDKADKPATTEG